MDRTVLENFPHVSLHIFQSCSENRQINFSLHPIISRVPLRARALLFKAEDLRETQRCRRPVSCFLSSPGASESFPALSVDVIISIHTPPFLLTQKVTGFLIFILILLRFRFLIYFHSFVFESGHKQHAEEFITTAFRIKPTSLFCSQSPITFN